MDLTEKVFTIIITLLIVAPLCVFIHEMGHAVSALFITKKKVQIMFGSFLKVADFKLGRLDLRLFLLPGFVGSCRWFGQISDLSSAVILISGPLASASICAVFSCVIFFIQTPELFYFSGLTVMAFSFTVFVFTSIPVNYPKWLPGIGGWPSDGLQAIRYIRKANKSKKYQHHKNHQ